jgi:hypothetical protein
LARTCAWEGENVLSRLAFVVVLISAALQAGSSPAFAEPPDCQGHWFWSHNLDLPQGFWSEGSHTYQMRSAINGTVVFTADPISFRVTPEAPTYPGQAQLRFYAVRVYAEGAALQVDQLNPQQDTYMQVSDDLRGSKAEADGFAASEKDEVMWDGGGWTAMTRGPVLSVCAFDPLRLGIWERQWGTGYRP